MKIDSPES